MHFEKPTTDGLSVLEKNLLETSKISIVVPAYNEETNLHTVVYSLPDYVDHILLIDDLSTDATAEVAAKLAKDDFRVVVISHEVNKGVGGAIASGYEWSRDNDVDVAVVMAGDGQMNPKELPAVVLPILDPEQQVDYTKGNRLVYKDAFSLIPHSRFIGNLGLSLLTKIASGYWHISDSQCGYTGISKRALGRIDWQKMYSRYGQPNDLLVSLNIHNFTVMDIPMVPVYGVGEVSKMKKRRVFFTIPKILVKGYLRRIWLCYAIYDFHPLILFLLFGLITLLASGILFISAIIKWMIVGDAPVLTTLSCLFCLGFSIQSFIWAFFMDMIANQKLARYSKDTSMYGRQISLS